MTLSRNARKHVRSALRKNPGWKAYVAQTSIDLNVCGAHELLAACAALNIDVAAIAATADSCAPTGWAPNATIGDAMPAFSNPLETKAEAEGEGADATDAEGAEAPASSPADALVGFEGRDPADLVSEALAPASAHMTQHLQATLPALLLPLAQAAAQGPRIVQQTVSAPSAGASMPPLVTVRKRVSLREAFRIKSRASDWQAALDTIMLPLCDCAEAPRVDHDYVWQGPLLAKMAACDSAGLNMWLHGPAGVGKTEGVAQYAARLGRPFIRIAIDRSTEGFDIIGQELLAKAADGGGMIWRDGKLARAFRTPYCVVLIDEPTLLRPGALAVFQTALDTRRLFLPTGEVLDAAPGVFIVAADNTDGTDDKTGRYADTAPMNAAFLDRFALRTAVGHMSQAQESTMVAHKSGLDAEACKIMVAYAGLTRADAEAGKLSLGVTPRRLLAWSKAVRAGIPSALAFADSIIAGSAPEDRETLLALEQTSLHSDHAKIDAIARGNVPASAPASSPAPTPSAAGSTFPESN